MDNEENKTICLIALDFPPQIGGISNYLSNLFSGFSPDKLKIICPPIDGIESVEKPEDIQVDRFWLPSNWEPYHKHLKFLAPFYLWTLLNQDQLGLILCGQAHYSLMIPAWILNKLRGNPYVVFTYGLDLLHPQTKFYKRPFNALLKKASIVISDSYAAEKIVRDLGIEKQRTVVIHPSIDIDNFKNSKKNLEVLQKFGLQDKKIILTVGRLIKRKGFDIVLRALPRILEFVPNAHYVIVGDGPEKSNINKLIIDLDLFDHTTMAGYVKDDDLDAYYEACDVFSMVCREIHESGDIEGFGIVFLEASLHGKPVVGSFSGGIPEAVVDEETGLLVQYENPDDTGDAIIRILTNEDFANHLGNTGRLRVKKDFSSKAAMMKLSNVINTLDI